VVPGLAKPILTATAVDLLDALDEGFALYDAAARSSGEAVVDLAIAEACVRLRIVGTTLVEPVLSALLHRRATPCIAPDLTIFVFDKASTGFTPSIVKSFNPRGGNASAIATWTHANLRLMYRHEPMPSLLGFDQTRNVALLWIDDAVDIPRWDRCRPLLQLLHWWLACGDWQPVHAAAVCGTEGGVLIAGKGGTGKSTAALACLRAGWRYAGDDFVLVNCTPRPRVENLFGTARLRTDMLARFPGLQSAVTNYECVGGYEKADLLLTKIYPLSSFSGFSIRAILLPRYGGSADCGFRRARHPEAMQSLAPTTMMMLHGDASASFRRIAAFIAATPAYWFDVGGDLDSIPAAIADILDRDLP
jgi:hypothetical protein